MKNTFLLVTAIILTYNCSIEPFSDEHEITVTINSEITENWITLEIENREENAFYIIERDSIIIFKNKLVKNDTVFHDFNLEPAKSYEYSVYAKKNGKKSESYLTSVTTMDTTSHDFEHEFLTFGDRSSELNDVAIVDQNDIWAVGHIYKGDSTFNAIRWDGQKWEYLQIPIREYNYTIIANLRGISVVNKNSIWFNIGASLIHWDGNIFRTVVFMRDYLESQNYSPLRNIWALNDNNIYLVSGAGNVISYDGKEYNELAQKTIASISDLWNSNYSQNPDIIYGAVSNKYSDSEYFIMKIEDDNIDEAFNWRETGESIFSIWFKDLNKIFAIGTHLTEKYEYGFFIYGKDRKWRDMQFPLNTYLLHSVRGQDINDLFICGDFFSIAHFNGKTWKNFDSYRAPGALYRMDYKDNILVAVGTNASEAVLIKITK